jgi:hypothetical protein
MKSRLFQLINQIVVFCITALTLLNVSAHAVEQTTSSSTSSLQFHYEPPLVFPVVNYGAFRDVTYVLQDDVVKVPGVLNHDFLQNNLKMREEVDGYSVRMSPYAKLAAGALIPRNSLEQSAGINLSQIKRSSSRSGDAATSSVSALIGTILVDETNGIAVKITGAQTNNSTEYLMLERPQIHEVVKDFKIPAQTVYLTDANLFPLSDAVSKSIVKTPKRGGDFSLLDQKFPHPLIRLGFDNVELQATLPDGSSVTVVLDGILILNTIHVDGDYSCFDGYSFQVNTGEGIGLKAKVLSDLNEEAVIPLFGIDIPAVVAHVRGGLFLKVGLHGDFAIGLQLSQWSSVTAGIRGGTAFCVPDSFHPIFSFDKGFDGDASFEGEINGALRVGPLLDLELFGFDVVGAGALIGIGASCKVTPSNDGLQKIDADLYAPLNVYATLLDHQLNLINQNFMLAQLHKVYSAGTDNNGNRRVFKVVLQEACAYQKTVWGVVYDLNQPSTNDGQPPPLKDALVIIEIDHSDGGIKPQAGGITDSNGFFVIRPVNLQKGDKVTVTRIGGVDVSSLPIEPTFPFKLVQLDYVDFFDDSSKGYVAPARVVDWEQTNKNNDGKKVYKEITYTGKITYDILANTVIDHADTTSTDGSFKLSYDFKPWQKAVAHVLWNGFDAASNMVTPDTNIMFTTIRDPISTSVYNGKDGYVKGRRIEQQHLMIYNLRGTKPVEEEIEGEVDYFLINKPYFICADQSSQLEIQPYIGKKTFQQKPIAIQDENTDDASKSISRYTISPSSPSVTISPNYYNSYTLNKPYGSSILSRYFITEWEWPVRDRISYNNYTNAIKISNQPDIVTAGGVKPFQTYFLFTDKANNLSKGDCKTALSPFQCDLLTHEIGGPEILQEILKGEEPIVSSKSLKFVYEGAEVPIKGEETYRPQCKKTLSMPADPLTEMTIDHWNWVTLPGPNQIVSPTISTPTLGNSISTSTFKNIGKKNMQ